MMQKVETKAQPDERLSNLLKGVVDLFFPLVCWCCGDRLDYEPVSDIDDEKKQKLWEINRYLCPACIDNLVVLSEDICPKCGNPVLAMGCPHCTKTNFAFTAARSVFLYDDRTKRLIHGLKYYQFLKVAPVLAAYASLYLENHWKWGIPDILVPVPLHKVKLRERGFNQSAIIGKWLAKFNDMEYRDDLLMRTRYTKTQTSLHRSQRHKNVKDAFCLKDADQLKNKSVLLIDDVFTTGATVDSIARTLKANKVHQVFVLTITKPS
jgi:competence protein ComFC